MGPLLAAVVATLVVGPPLPTAADTKNLPPIDFTEPDQPGVAAIPGEEQLAKGLRRTPVFFRTTYPKGTIFIVTQDKYLYLYLGDNRAYRYGIAVGRDGFQWTADLVVTKKVQWPSWRPPKEMIEREAKKGHKLPEVMDGGPDNPLGARALYLGYTEYRIHGTNQPKSIGHAASSGCIRMLNEHVIDLYEKVPVGTRVIVS
jgi:lipoprotein-anchoring transpeptidase ErfK/SrfK